MVSTTTADLRTMMHVALDAQAAQQDGHDDREGRLVDGRDVRGGHELVEARLALGVGVHVGRDDGVDERVHVRVVDDRAALLAAPRWPPP